MEEDKNLIRIGIVSSVDPSKFTARVYYPQMDDLVSDWLPILQRPVSVSMIRSGPHKHSGATTTDGAHMHDVMAENWMPKVNDRVLVLYEQGFSKDGYILGVLR